jgi:hypothetical protein
MKIKIGQRCKLSRNVEFGKPGADIEKAELLVNPRKLIKEFTHQPTVE